MDKAKKDTNVGFLRKFFITGKKTKIFSVFVLVVAFASLTFLFVKAQSVSDDFTTTDDVADTWQVEVATTTGEVKLAARTCNIFDWFCNASTTCANYLGDGDYIIVAQADASTTKQWKTANTACDKPECGADGGQNGDNLVADNTVVFTDYPARDYCKSIGGRLPTIDELSCMYTNRATFGDNFGTGYYWSDTESSVTYARLVYFTDGSVSYYNKTSSYYVRCVRGW